MDGNLFTSHLLDWYDANGRDLPWRREPNPYRVWISEIMAQQTQLDRVVGYFDRWMARYPDLQSLALAREEDVLKLWEGLGYYSRARNILKSASVLAHAHGCVFPSDPIAIRALPGVGAYTAGAVASIAFGLCEPAVDANVLRVFARLLDLDAPVAETGVRQTVERTVRALIPEDRPGDFNQALMELGALVCAKRPRCGECPVRAHCLAHARGVADSRPVLPPSRKAIRIEMATGVLVRHGRVLIQKRRPGDVWPGLWEFPGGCVEPGETPRQALAREFREEVELVVEPVEKITVVAYSYTRYRVTMHCYRCRLTGDAEPVPVFNEAAEGGFVLPAQLAEYAFPAGHRRLIEFMERDARAAGWFDAGRHD
ncbi:MAG: A/G-specific adenine glycosylase [Pseudodesulfovibrio sp.]|uniref:Adenine DNA glycosylase n=1 Tax=Pseudodesulfovibrio aespoeensis (strain ATCC 700646 / DSM 10631 / Aspo-2) TaxID=643562 RepID=E6VQU9_PSEA9|nr:MULTISPECIES: A/G-specific adenine glycosylase [Pseudodesulfovibrio]MBU4191753.1 A/G-specific adenine glycosylase [Pseudomonadota bacterium]ADU62929.1 A/G-specific adenine glycosylase [Pseudodesulfovibrio aespoeensis Aspo-2]MBU4243767.1 A/G-specific adenine glycosylase [Pseudomonadota bacterium]MBU4378344.1 A/G-specific adenine glycosylase [Pseudomonadota bacterium]MBU4473739.1 A/G-specific adenine glycosylase [Pseudomonadota bacterium]